MDETLDALPLATEHSALIGVVAFHTMQGVTALFEGVTGNRT
jgi:hypothetical protein